MTWDEMAIDMLEAAKASAADHPRTAVSRSYYAAHLALAKTLIAKGYVPPAGNSTQSHASQSRLIGQYLSNRGEKKIKELRMRFARLRSRRIESDYIPRVTIGRALARDSIRDSAAVLMELGVQEVQ